MSDPRKTVLVLGPGEGRAYACGTMQAVFKADEAETGAAYSISEWRLEPRSGGPGPHSHEANDDVFYVVEGEAVFTIDGRRIEAAKGAFVRVPAGAAHDFANEGDAPLLLLNIYVPGGFERDMPAIAAWFAKAGGSEA